jgi:hypothetical protein
MSLQDALAGNVIALEPRHEVAPVAAAELLAA